MKEVELINKRKSREKHFLQEDGTIIAKIYNTDIHFKKNGKYEEIDNTLVKEKGCYCNKCNDYKVKYQEESDIALMRMEKDKYFLEIKLKDSKKSKGKKNNIKSKFAEELLYEDILDGIDIEYKTLSNKVKETIVLHRYERKKLLFIINTNLTLIQDNKTIVAQNENKRIFTIEKPFMEDSLGKINNNISYNLTKKDNNAEYELELVLDDKWLKSKEVVYPVYIDPTITNNSQENGLYDTYIYPGDTGVNKNSQAVLKAGIENVNGTNIENRTLIKFDLPEIGTGSEIVAADITFVGYLPSSNHDIAESKLVTVHRITEDWTEETANWENMSTKFDERVEAIFECWRSSLDGTTILPQLMGSDITSIVKKWYRETDNFGLMIQTVDKNYIDEDYQAFFSKDNTISGENKPKPIISITYRNQNGIETYMDYKTQTLTAGKVYINTFNGNMVSIFDLATTKGSQLPATIRLIYNTNDVVLNNETSVGKGFKLNLEQKLKIVTIDEKEYLEYLDADGTLHYFYQSNENIYVDEDGLGLSLEKSETTCTIKDGNNNRMIFSKINDLYILTTIKDAENNTITIELDDNNRITKVKDKHSEITITYGDELVTIISSGETTKLHYTNNKITSVETIDGITVISYNEKELISEIIDITGLKLSYEYCNEKPFRIKKVIQYGINNTEGQSYSLEYGFDTTKITNNKGSIETLIFNQYGNLVSRNSLKTDEDISDAYSICQSYGYDSYHKNKILSEVIPVTYIKNYLKNTSFELDNILFTYDEGVEHSFTEETAFSGNRSMKLVTYENNKSAEQTVIVDKGKYYTFSGYFKNDQNMLITLYYTDQEGNEISKSREVEASNEFEREDVSLFFESNAASDLKIKITSLVPSTIYVDDIQLEEGEVANLYNIIENSDFSEGISDWNLTAYEIGKEGELDAQSIFECVKFNNEKNSAIKVKMKPQNSTFFRKSFPIKGKKGDLYTVSFWYKNEGVFGCRQYAGNNVTIYFKPTDGEAEYCIVPCGDFNPNENMWQYFTYRSSALEDFREIELIFSQNTEANNLYITNISLYKNVTSGDYQYDDNGNLVAMTTESNENGQFAYNQNNKLVSATDPNGVETKYEYDSLKEDRVITKYSTNGISNCAKYDSNGNIISNKVVKSITNDIKNGQYRIRNKGTDKYLKAELNMVLSESNSCSNTIWEVEKDSNDNLKFKYAVLPNYYIANNGDNIILSTNDENNMFVIEACDNGSYHIIRYLSDQTKKYLKSNNGVLQLTDYELNDLSYEFYFETPDSIFIENNTEYTDDGRYIKSITDSNFNTTTYETDSNTGLIRKITDANGQITENVYNDKHQLMSVQVGEKSVSYQYNNQNLLSTINHGNKTYKFIYDEFMNKKQVLLGDSIILSTNEYENNNGNLASTTYGNNNKIRYEYDEFDRIKTIHKNNESYQFKYDNSGNLAKVVSANKEIKYLYDQANRLYKYDEDDFKIKFTYDASNNIIRKKYKLDNIERNQENTINNTGATTKINNNNTEFYYTYDDLGRLKDKKIGDTSILNYQYITHGKRTSGLVEKISVPNGYYNYEYDKLNNLTHVYIGETLAKRYYYDIYNELIKEENYQNNRITEYTYNSSGNLQKETIKNISDNTIIEEINYEYTNSLWEDQLTQYAGTNITYDGAGNTVTVGDNITMSWIDGILLNSYSNSDENSNIAYKYNVDGRRISKTINGVETKYYLEGTDIIFEKTADKITYYMYDLTGIIGLDYNGNKYYYIKNAQEDIVGILNENYVQVVSYEYDSWGNIVSIVDSTDEKIGTINPFRYRSYYYDNETQLYYLNNRYYNPKWKRFISPDSYLCANRDIISNNLYVYCSNNPINNSDNTGESLFVLACKLIKAGVKIYTKIKKSLEKKEPKKKKKKKTTKKLPDYTEQLNKVLEKNKRTANIVNNTTTYVGSTAFFYEKEQIGGDWDYKLEENWSRDIDVPYLGYNGEFIFNGEVITAEDFGNMHYGYIGSAMSYPETVLYIGGGYARCGITEEIFNPPYYCDDKNDHISIQKGINMYYGID